MLKEFRAFVLRGNVVDLAVGVVIGAAFKTIVDSFVNGLLNPLIAFASTGTLKEKAFCVGRVSPGGACAHLFNYGEVISSVISFALIAAVVFFLVVKPVNHLVSRLKPVVETTRECPECLSAIPRAARRCAFCTAPSAPPA